MNNNGIETGSSGGLYLPLLEKRTISPLLLMSVAALAIGNSIPPLDVNLPTVDPRLGLLFGSAGSCYLLGRYFGEYLPYFLVAEAVYAFGLLSLAADRNNLDLVSVVIGVTPFISTLVGALTNPNRGKTR